MQRLDRRLALFVFCAAWGILPALASGARADSVVLRPSKDNTLIESDSGLLSNGAGPSMFSGRTRRFGVRRAVLAFPVAASIPAQARIDSVQLELTVEENDTGVSAVRVHRLLRDWGEGTSSTAGGGGDQASDGDATWLHTFYPDTFWDQPGGDFDLTASATLLVGQGGPYTWGSTEKMVADVQDWVTDPPTNFGWILIGDEDEVSAKLYATREADEILRPRLTVHFTRPTVVEATTWSVVKRLYR